MAGRGGRFVWGDRGAAKRTAFQPDHIAASNIKKWSIEGGSLLKKLLVRKAVIEDAKAIFDLIENFSQKGGMLYRPLQEIYDVLRDFFVFEENGEITGVCSLHIWGPELGEIRSLAVRDKDTRKGMGSRLVTACLEEAKKLGLKNVFALTYMRGFFEKQGFTVVDKMKLPQKIWGDCNKCGKFPSCDETAVIRSISASGEGRSAV